MDKPNYPKQALREGILNALIHRDYSSVSGSVLIAVHPDRIEITNYGTLPIEIKPSDLKKNHLSMPRNPDIAHICFLRAWIEKLGRGTLKIIDNCKEYGFNEPKWISKAGTTSLVFSGIETIISKDDGVSDVVNDGVNDGVIDGVSDGVKDELINVTKIIAVNEGIKTSDIAKKLGKTKPTTERYIIVLRKTGIIERKGSFKTGGYYLTDKVKEQIKK